MPAVVPCRSIWRRSKTSGDQNHQHNKSSTKLSPGGIEVQDNFAADGGLLIVLCAGDGLDFGAKVLRLTLAGVCAAKVVQAAFCIGLHGCTARLPVRWAHLHSATAQRIHLNAGLPIHIHDGDSGGCVINQLIDVLASISNCMVPMFISTASFLKASGFMDAVPGCQSAGHTCTPRQHRRFTDHHQIFTSVQIIHLTEGHPFRLHHRDQLSVAAQTGADGHLAMLLKELEGLQQPLGLVHAASDGGTVHCDLLETTLLVDDEESAQCNARLLYQDSVLGRNFLHRHKSEGRKDRKEVSWGWGAHVKLTPALLLSRELPRSMRFCIWLHQTLSRMNRLRNGLHTPVLVVIAISEHVPSGPAGEGAKIRNQNVPAGADHVPYRARLAQVTDKGSCICNVTWMLLYGACWTRSGHGKQESN